MYSKRFSGRKRLLGEDFWCRRSMVTKYQLLESESSAIPVCAAVAALGATRGDEKARSPNEERNQQWWDDGFNNWSDVQFKKRLHVTKETFTFLLDSVVDDIRKETTRFKKPTSPERQLGLTLYRLAHGSSYTTVGDLFGVAPSTACTIFNHVTQIIGQKLYDQFVILPRTEEEWKAELTSFLEDWEFPCVGAWDGFHVFISSNLKNFFSFQKRYSVTNMGLTGCNKRFLWAGVGAPGSMRDSIILQSSDIFNAIEAGNYPPNKVLTLPGYGEIPFATVGDAAFPPRSWLLKAFPDSTKDAVEKSFNKKLRAARVVSEHAQRKMAYFI